MLSLAEHIYSAGFLRGELSDVKIVAFNKEYNLHKLILDRSPYFHSLFSAKWDTDGRPVHNLDFSIDQNITEQAFDLCLQRLYGGAEEPSEILGFPERVSAAFELFATANFLNLTELVDFCLLLIINSLTKYTVAETLCFALENHYPQSDTIIDSCKSFLCAEGSEMSYLQWSRIPIPIVVEVVSSDGFFIQSEWERCMWVVGFLTEEDYLSDFNNNESPPEPEADEDSDSSSHFDIGLEKLSGLNAEINLSTPTGSYTELNRLGTEPIGSPEQVKKTSSTAAPTEEEEGETDNQSTTSLDSETASQLHELTKAIHYCHLSLAQLQHLEKIKDKRGKLLFDKSVLQDGLWQQMKLKQLVLGTGDDRLDVCMSPKQLMELGAEEGDDTDLYYPVPSHDKSVAGRRSNDAITAKDYYTGRCDPEAPLETSDPDAQVTFSPFPPFRFSVKFDDISQLKGESKLYTDNAVWYAGTWWSVYLQKINKKSPQLGVYLHREARTQRDLATGANSSYTLLSGKSTAKSTVGLDDTTAMELKTEPRLVSFPATEQPADYNDDRPQIMSYFEIYTPSKRGKNLTCFSSSPSAFSCAQSWGWRSSSLYHYAEENAKQHTRASLKFMVVIGVVFNSSRFSTAMWTPLPKIGRGVLLKTVRLDGLHAAEAVSDINGTFKTSNKDIRIGEEVFVFEQHSGGEWYRAYVVSSPSAMNILMDVLEHTDVVSDENVKPPDAKIVTAVFPASCVKIKDYFEIKEINRQDQNDNAAYNLGKPFAPPVPALRLGIESPMLEGEPLVDDIISVIGEWNKVYLCRFFVNRNYAVVNELNSIIKELYVIRRQLLYQLLTEEETLLTRRRAIWLILKAKKMMSQGILVRDTVTGEILTGREDPVKLAKEQLLINLSPKYPNYNTIDERSVLDVHLPTHISVKLVESDGQAGDGALTAFIYLRSRTKRLTEAFRISVDASLVLSDLSTVLFTNIPAQVVKDEIYIVVVLSEEVPVSATSKKRVRRGIAAGVQSLSRIFQDFTHREKELTINMYASYSETGQYGQANRGWGDLVDRIIKGETVGVGKTPRADKVTLAVKDFQAPTASQLDFKANTAMFPATSLFLDSLIPKRDDLYVYLKTMTLAKGFDGADLISLNLQTAYGKVAFTKASNVEPVGGWFAASVYNGESIGEVVRVSDCGHGWNDTLYFNIFLGADFLGRGILQLWTNDRITSDGHKVIDIINSDRVKCATLEVSVDYVGNSFNVPPAIVTVNNWKKYFNSGLGDELMNACNGISKVPDPEFTLHFHRVVNNLCQIILAVDNEAYRDAAFGGLIHALEVVSLKHHGNHAYLADDWLSHFSFVGIAKPLLAYIHKTKKVQKCGQYLANLIATAARVDIGVSEDKHAARKDLAVSLHHVIDDIVDAIKTDTPNKQTIALIGHLPTWLENMRPLVGNRDCMETYIRFVDSIRPGNDKLTVAKLLFIQEMSRSWMFKEAKYRARLASFTIRWTLPFITKVESGTITTFKKDLFRLVCAIFANQISILWPSRETEKGIIGMYVPLLPLFARTYVALLAHYKEFGRKRRTYTELFPSKYPFVTVPVDSRSDAKFDECLIEMGTIFMSIVTFANISGMSLPSSSLSRSELTEIILNILQACSAMLANQSFPKTWTSLVTLHHDTVFGTLTYLNSLLVEKFIPSPEQAEEFDASIWYTYLSTLLQVTGSDIIAIEFLSEQKRKAMWSLLGDIRGRASAMLQQTWDLLGWQASPEEQHKYGLSRLGGFQVNLYVGDTSLVVGILYMCLGKHAGAQAVAVNILKSMIVGEWILNDDLSQITREVIAGLDSVFQHKTFLPDEEDKNRFLQLLRQSLPDEVSSIAEDIEEFTDLLYDLHTIPAGDQYNDDRIFHTLNVLNFLRSLDKVEIFSRYVHDIAQWHVAKQNHVQAGLSLVLLSNAYSWDKTAKLGPSKFPKLPAQSEFARKEALLRDAIDYFERSDCLESSVDALKQLQVAYEQSYDFSKLAEVTKQLANTYNKVDTQQRDKPKYFRVTLLGGGFPKSLRGRHFIFEASAYERLETIHDTLYRVHPKAVIIPNENQARDEGQFLHVTAVQPMPQASHILSPAATDGAREYYDRQNMRLFSFTRASGPSDNPTQMWTEKTIYETYQPFPTIVNRSEVKSIQVVKLSPAENALQTLNSKINELQAIESSFLEGRGDTNLLPLVLEGAIDSGVGGGIHQYRVFIEDGDASIQQAFIDYAHVVKKCLAVHDRVMSPKMRQLHESLCERFRKLFAPELADIGDDIAGARVAIKHPTGQF